jgi:CHAT domain-containing protein
MSEHRPRLFALADRLVALHPADRKGREALTGICEALYRYSALDPLLMAELEAWLEIRRGRSEVIDSWLALARLARLSSGDSAEGDLKLLDGILRQSAGRAGLVLRTEAARHLWRVEGDPARAWERLREEPPPDPSLKEAASEAAVVWLRLAAMAADWRAHDLLALALQERWTDLETPAAAWIAITIAEHEIQRGFFATALNRLKPLTGHADPWVRMAALEVTLRTLLDCDSNAASERLKAELQGAADLLKPLLELETPTDTFPPSSEWAERRRVSRLLLDHVSGNFHSPVGGNSSILTQALALEREGDKPGALDLATAVLASSTGWELPEESLRLRLLFVRLTLELARDLTPAEVASCEDLVSSVLIEAEARGLPLIEMLAWDQRALIRGHLFENRWGEAVSDAGRAANLAARLVEANRGSFVERPLRASLLPVLDRAVELLAEGALRAAAQGPEGRESHERFGRAILDYVEQSMELALAEARAGIRAGEAPSLSTGMPSAPPRPKRCESLQATLSARDGVLQHFLVGRFLLVFAYGRSFFDWCVEAPEGLPSGEGVPIRSFLQKLLPGGFAGSLSQPIPYRRDLAVPQALPAARSEGELGKLASHLLPESVVKVLKRERVRRLAIVPHDILYRAPFGRLSCCGDWLTRQFALSIHPTGAAAAFRSPSLKRRERCRASIGFFIGPKIHFAQDELRELRTAFGRAADVEEIDTVTDFRAFLWRMETFEVLYLACHGRGPGEDPKQAALELGGAKALVTLPEIGSLHLKRCRLAVLQACWTGWMDHVREFPAQGFPQALLDAGVAAVVAPMLPVNDTLCPIFTAVFCRVLRFRPAAEALGYTLDLLRGRGKALVPNGSQAGGSAFDVYEYRFTGDQAVDLTGGWLDRKLAWCTFQLWLWKRILASRRAALR